MDEDDATLEATIVELLAARAPNATICPSDAARAAHPDDWREWMEPTRRAAARLVADGTVTVTQRGRPVDLTATGPIRIRLNP